MTKIYFKYDFKTGEFTEYNKKPKASKSSLVSESLQEIVDLAKLELEKELSSNKQKRKDLKEDYKAKKKEFKQTYKADELSLLEEKELLKAQLKNIAKYDIWHAKS